jgi:UDP-N-acetylglucosamine 2-epimerase (non-hydrolysing)
MAVAGTRPEIIKMAPVIRGLRRFRDIETFFVFSGQHYDEDMSDRFIFELGLPEPVERLEAGSGSHGEQTAKVLVGCERSIRRLKADLVLSEGDTNTALATALASVKLHVPYGHVEAGLRCFDRKMPEEINRVLADHCAALCFAPTERSALNLAFEGVPAHRIFVTGNTIVDACLENLKMARGKSKILDRLGISSGDNFALVTCHRAENTDNRARLTNIVDALTRLVEYRIVFPVHPRAKRFLVKYGLWEKLSECRHIVCTGPLGYFDLLLLL